MTHDPTHYDYLRMARCDLRAAQGEVITALAELEKARIEAEFDSDWQEVVNRAAVTHEVALAAVDRAKLAIAHHEAGLQAERRPVAQNTGD